jgi:D-aminoacyl-tRNA deacylase
MNNFTIITSIKDPASNTMKNCLVEDERFEMINNHKTQNQYNNHTSENYDYKIYNSIKHPNTTLIITNQNLINIDNIDTILPRDNMTIFLSKHASKSKNPTLTSHSTGNFSESVLLGGKPMEIGNTFPSFQKFYMQKLYEKRSELLDYDIIIEATHHGPTSSVNPMLFIEIGSSEKEWDNKSTASIVCQSVLDTIKSIEKNIKNYDIDVGIGIGGNHYPQKFNELILFSRVAFGPIISKYNLAFINEQIIKQMKVKSIEKITRIYIDEKGLGKEKEKVLDIARSQELELIFV